MSFLIFPALSVLNTDSNTVKHASNEKTQSVGYKYGGFRGSVGMWIPWGFPQVFLWVWDGYGD